MGDDTELDISTFIPIRDPKTENILVVVQVNRQYDVYGWLAALPWDAILACKPKITV